MKSGLKEGDVCECGARVAHFYLGNRWVDAPVGKVGHDHKPVKS